MFRQRETKSIFVFGQREIKSISVFRQREPKSIYMFRQRERFRVYLCSDREGKAFVCFPLLGARAKAGTFVERGYSQHDLVGTSRNSGPQGAMIPREETKGNDRKHIGKHILGHFLGLCSCVICVQTETLRGYMCSERERLRVYLCSDRERLRVYMCSDRERERD